MERERPSLPFRLLFMGKGMGHLLEHRASVRGLNRTQSIILRMLGHHPGMQAQDLRFPAGVEPANVSRSLQSLERMGLVRREPHPTDGRASIFSLTEKGQANADEVALGMRELRRALLKGIDPQELAIAERVMDTLWQNIHDQLVESGLHPPHGHGPETHGFPRPATGADTDGPQDDDASRIESPAHRPHPHTELGTQGADRPS